MEVAAGEGVVVVVEVGLWEEPGAGLVVAVVVVVQGSVDC